MKQIFAFDSLNLIADYVQLDLWFMSLIVTFSMTIFLFVIEYLQYVKNATVSNWLKTPEFLTLLMFMVLLFGEFEHKGFIYFQF